MNTPNLTPAEQELLAILAEECAEVIQAVTKVLRHGYSSMHPDRDEDNRFDLETECGHVRQAMLALCDAGDLSKEQIHNSAAFKELNIKRYTHFQG